MVDPCTAFRLALENGDVDAATALFVDDVVFRSPVVHEPYRGREQLRMILTAVVQVFEDFRYVEAYADDTDPRSGQVLRFTCRIGDRDVDGVDILRSDGRRLTELSVLIRPYSAITVLRERMAALLA